jgi:SHS2 domain-containing protein
MTGADRERWPEGVLPLDHTADVGLSVLAPSLEALFDRAAAGMRGLIEGTDGGAAADASQRGRTMEVEADDVGALLVAWLRELLFLHQVEQLAYRSAAFESLGEMTLRAEVIFGSAARRPVREIKGVTYHGLEAVAGPEGWRARVIFDV